MRNGSETGSETCETGSETRETGMFFCETGVLFDLFIECAWRKYDVADVCVYDGKYGHVGTKITHCSLTQRAHIAAQSAHAGGVACGGLRRCVHRQAAAQHYQRDFVM